MGNLNKTLLIGFLGNDPEKRVTSGGNSVVSVNLSTTDRWKDQQGNKQEKTEWHRLVFWNQQAEILEQYAKKGSQLYVEGSLETRKWQNKDGVDMYTTEIKVRSFQFLDRLPQNNQQQNTQPQNQNNQQQPNQGYQQPQQNYQQPPHGEDWGPEGMPF